MNPRMKKCNWLIREFDQVVLLWNQRIDSTEKKKPNKDEQLITSVHIHINLLITQESSNTNPTSNSKSTHINQYQIVIVGQIQDIQPIPMRIQNWIYNQGIQDRPYQGHLKSQPMTNSMMTAENQSLHHRMTLRICCSN